MTAENSGKSRLALGQYNAALATLHAVTHFLIPFPGSPHTPQDAMVTMDHDVNRVRIYVDKEGKVARPPRVG